MVITCWQLWIAIWPLLAILMNCSSDLIGKATAADHLRPLRWQPGCSVISSHCFRLRYKTTDCLAKSLYDAYTVIQGAGRPIISLNTTLILFRRPKMARWSNIASWLWEICGKKKGEPLDLKILWKIGQTLFWVLASVLESSFSHPSFSDGSVQKRVEMPNKAWVKSQRRWKIWGKKLNIKKVQFNKDGYKSTEF